MESIIVTITNPTRSFFYDIEVPTTVTFDKLKEDIVEALNGYKPNLFLGAATSIILCNRTNHLLADEETIESAGIWNGDYLTIKEV